MFSSMCMIFRLLFVIVFFFLWSIVLYVLLRYTDSDYPFAIFKLFLHTTCYILLWKNKIKVVCLNTLVF